MFERIVSQCPPDFCSQSTNSTIVSNVNVNTRQREIKKPQLPSPVAQFIKKGKF